MDAEGNLFEGVDKEQLKQLVKLKEEEFKRLLGVEKDQRHDILKQWRRDERNRR